MIDGWIRGVIDPPLGRAGQRLAASGLSADTLSIGGCALGLGAALAAAVRTIRRRAGPVGREPAR